MTLRFGSSPIDYIAKEIIAARLLQRNQFELLTENSGVVQMDVTPRA